MKGKVGKGRMEGGFCSVSLGNTHFTCPYELILSFLMSARKGKERSEGGGGECWGVSRRGGREC